MVEGIEGGKKERSGHADLVQVEYAPTLLQFDQALSALSGGQKTP